MEIIPVPVQAFDAPSRCALRAHRIGRVKFVSLPMEVVPVTALRGRRGPGRVGRFIFRVIGRLAAARP
ncbi:MAG: hypothetical protein ACXWF0_11325 [Usitatibacter sp.]